MSLYSKPRIEWHFPDSLLMAMTPTTSQIAEQALTLATFFNEPHNRHMMGNTITMTVSDVTDHYATLEANGGLPFLLFVDDVLVGDADFRHPTLGQIEFAIVMGPRHTQGKGLGTRFALMLHAWAFAHLNIERIFVTILQHNQASLHLFEKLGYRHDPSPAARALTEQGSDYALSISREEFSLRHADLLPAIHFLDPWGGGHGV